MIGVAIPQQGSTSETAHGPILEQRTGAMLRKGNFRNRATDVAWLRWHPVGAVADIARVAPAELTISVLAPTTQGTVIIDCASVVPTRLHVGDVWTRIHGRGQHLIGIITHVLGVAESGLAVLARTPAVHPAALEHHAGIRPPGAELEDRCSGTAGLAPITRHVVQFVAGLDTGVDVAVATARSVAAVEAGIDVAGVPVIALFLAHPHETITTAR